MALFWPPGGQARGCQAARLFVLYSQEGRVLTLGHFPGLKPRGLRYGPGQVQFPDLGGMSIARVPVVCGGPSGNGRGTPNVAVWKARGQPSPAALPGAQFSRKMKYIGGRLA